MKPIKIGYEVGTGEEIKITPKHLIVTGISQESGKTTTLEAVIVRSNLQAIVFKTKPGEMGFIKGTVIPPYFVEHSNWEYVKSLLEATMKQKLKFETAWIIHVCKGTSTLAEVKKNIEEKLRDPKTRGLNRNVYTVLNEFLLKALPQLQAATFSRSLELNVGVNIMELERFSDEVQGLVIRSVMENVLKQKKKTIIVIPESWKFLPQKRGGPCKDLAETFIRQGAAKGNFLWLDSQDITGIDKQPLKQVSTWILGKQSEINEVRRTLDQVPLPRHKRPKPSEIMTLGIGQFYVCTSEFVKKVYVQPTWLDSEKAQQIAMGKMDLKGITKPIKLVPYERKQVKAEKEISYEDSKTVQKLKSDLIEMRNDFFDAQQELRKILQNQGAAIIALKMKKQEINEDEIVSRVLQKTATNGISQPINTEGIIEAVLSRVPKTIGTTVYEVAPLEKIKKDFLEETKGKLLGEISELDEKQKKILKWLEQKGAGVAKKELFLNCFGRGAISGSTYTSLVKKLTEMKVKELIHIATNNKVHPFLKKRIAALIQQYGASDAEMQQVYDHILYEMLG